MALASALTLMASDADADGAVQSLTNNQVYGVDELDSVKTDGRYLFVWDGREIVVVRLHTAGEVKVVDRLAVEGTLHGFFLSTGKLTVITSRPAPAPTPGGEGDAVVVIHPVWAFGGWGGAREIVVTVFDRGVFPMRAERALSLDGSLLGARMIGDHLFLFAQSQLWVLNGSVSFPSYTADGVAHPAGPEDIGYLPGSEGQSLVITVFAVDVSSGGAPRVQWTLGSPGHTIYVSRNSLFVSSSRVQPGSDGEYGTWIHKIPLRSREVACASAGWVPGALHNQFSMDEHGGHLRVATTVRALRAMSNTVTILDGEMEPVGRLDGLAPGESIYAARFMGDRLYLVTFKKVDPLFVIDVSDPAAPRVLGTLKIPGVSDYLHPVAPGFVLGVGRDTADAGSFAWFQGLKLSLFDVRDVERPLEVANYFIGDRGTWTPVRFDHKAFTWIPEYGLIVLPVHEFDIDESGFPGGVPPSAFGQEVWQGAYVLRLSGEGGFRLLAKITHHDASAEPACHEYVYRSSESIVRSFGIGPRFYVVSQEYVTLHLGATGTAVGAVRLSLEEAEPLVCPQPRPVVIRIGD